MRLYGVNVGFLTTSLLLTDAVAQSPKINHLFLPFGSYPSVEQIRPNPLNVLTPTQNETKAGSLEDEVKLLTERVKGSVRGFAQHRNATCFGQPCLVQAFPLIYNKIDSGFFGGFRANVSSTLEQGELPTKFELAVLRSDTQQWNSLLNVDSPKTETLPLSPRSKTRLSYNRSTDTRYYGTGEQALLRVDVPIQDLRYSLEEIGVQQSFIFPVFRIMDQELGLVVSASGIQHRPSAFVDPARSILFQDQPRGLEGGRSGRWGLGVILDSRDREVFARQGWALEVSASWAGPPVGDYRFQRFSLIDRRYLNWENWTLAHRFTIDQVSQGAPFWELASVGGIDPIGNVSGSPILRGFYPGRFHEQSKFISTSELRFQLKARRIFNQLTQIVIMPLSIDLARLGPQNAAAFGSGVKFQVNRALLFQTYFAKSKEYLDLNFKFGQEF